MKNFGKISIVAGIAAALFVLLRKRKDGTRMLDDVTHQVSKWANLLKESKNEFIHSNGQSANKSTPRTALRTSTVGVGGRKPGDIQE